MNLYKSTSGCGKGIESSDVGACPGNTEPCLLKSECQSVLVVFLFTFVSVCVCGFICLSVF